MIQIITCDDLHYEFTDVFNIELTNYFLNIYYQHPNDDAHVCTFNLSEIKYLATHEPFTTIKFNVMEDDKNENN